jgi:hypothetical protein
MAYKQHFAFAQRLLSYDIPKSPGGGSKATYHQINDDYFIYLREGKTEEINLNSSIGQGLAIPYPWE